MNEVKNTEKMGCAVIGYGGMGGWHTRYILESDVCYLCGIYDIKPEKIELAKANGIRAYSSLEELLADDEIKFVTIATPNELHAELAIKAMRAGKHVITEKPVVINSEELEEVLAVSKETGMLFTVHQNRRWDIDFRMMREAYLCGKLGRVFSCESRIQGSRGIPGDWRGKPEHGGGMIYDWGVHLIDQMLLIFADKKVRSVRCLCEHVTNKEVDDGFKLDIIFTDDTVGHIEVGTHHFIGLPRFYMTGTGGAAIIEDWRDTTRIVSMKKPEEGEVKPVITSAGMTKTMAPRAEDSMEESFIERMASDVHDFYRNFTAAIRGEAEQIVTHDQMRRVLRVIEAAFESDKLGATVPFEEV
ncbi:MAG: Gfo/Idh/MocA family protein [Eubacteriales bacterium]